MFAAFCDAGLWPGCGPALREKLPAAGVRRPDDVTEPALAAIEGVSAQRASKLVMTFSGLAPTYEVAQLLSGAGLPVRLAAGVATHLAPAPAARLSDDPWRLLDAPEADLAQADRLASHLGVDRGSPTRGPAVIAHLLALAARSGDTAVPAPRLLSLAASRGVPDPAAELALADDSGRVVVSDSADEHATDMPAPDEQAPEQLVALARYAMAEDAIAEGVARLMACAEPIGEPDALGASGLDDTQRAAVLAVLTHGLSLLTGGPGTGKSRSVAAVVELAKARGRRVALAAPTGRAAKRLEELTGAPATTLHRLLGAQPGREDPDGGPTFARDEDWPLDAELVVVDEASMLDVEMAAGLLSACADGTHLLLVGDPAQLPSIGAGRVLGDLVDAGVVPTTELTTLYRQAEGGTIARLATAVRGGELPAVDDPAHEVAVVPAADATDAARRVVQLVTDAIPRALGITAADVQVVTPVHRGPAGTIALNAALKLVLNPAASGRGTGRGKRAGQGPSAGGARPSFDPGDRVVAVANHLEAGFANGEVGVVQGWSDDGLLVLFPSGPASVSRSALGDLRHGWAITVHRAQGSEWPAVVVVVPPESGGLLTRPLVYTAFTRAQRHLSVVPAVGRSLSRAVRDTGGRQRCTRLGPLLRTALEVAGT